MLNDDHEDQDELQITIEYEWFAKHALTFPCFADAPDDTSAESLVNQIMGAFNDDNLTESQEYVVELLLHLSHQDSIFNLNRALAVWSDEDQAAFIAMIRGNPN